MMGAHDIPILIAFAFEKRRNMAVGERTRLLMRPVSDFSDATLAR